MKIKTALRILLIPLIAVLTLSSCQPPSSQTQDATTAPVDPIWGPIWFGMEMKFGGSGVRDWIEASSVDHTFKASIAWRPYSAALDSSVKTWYGDQGGPPPKYVVESLKVWVDGRHVPVKASQYRYLCSQWEPKPNPRRLEFHQRGNRYRLAISVGDGGESWAGVYEINAKEATLLKHTMEDGVEVSNSTR